MEDASRSSRERPLDDTGARREEAPCRRPPSSDALYELALRNFQQNEFEKCQVLLAKLLEIEPRHVGALHRLGLVHLRLGQDAEALASFEAALAFDPRHVPARISRGALLFRLKRLAKALLDYDEVLAIVPEHVETLANRGVVLHLLKRFEDAQASFDRALAIDPRNLRALVNQAITLKELERFDEAVANYDRALALDPHNADVLTNRGSALLALERLSEALASYERAIAIDREHVKAWSNRAVVLKKLHRVDEALASCDRALAIAPLDSGAVRNKAIFLKELGRFEEALAFLDQVLPADPVNADLLEMRASALLKLRRFDEALIGFGRALSIDPRHAAALNNRAIALRELSRLGEALESCNAALAIEPDSPIFLLNRGSLLIELLRHEEALTDCEKALAIGTEPRALETIANAAMRACDWSRVEELKENLYRTDPLQAFPFPPFTLINYCEDPDLLLRGAKGYVGKEFPPSTPLDRKSERKARSRERVRIAYVSADFHEHATSYLTAELFERHDRGLFELFGISFGPDDKSEMRARLVGAFERFHDVRSMADRNVAKLMNEHAIDIAVDLKGHTQGSRFGIFVHRPAPIQVSYLGFPSTTGADFIDYVIGDEIVLPLEEQPFWSEKIVHLPGCYQVNDRKRQIAERTARRDECGLPERGFVFCCFNNNYKITPPLFDTWMRLLQKIEGSVLWLLRDNATAERNLRREAASRGIDPGRLVFADRLALAEHLARHRLADLFLDTLPVIAHTTASDALWAGLPVLTCLGKTFAGRVAGSLLYAVGLPELVTKSLEEYEALALKLAHEPSLLSAYRERLEKNRLTAPLFDSDRFRRHLEHAYLTMLEMHDRGEKPRGFAVAAPNTRPGGAIHSPMSDRRGPVQGPPRVHRVDERHDAKILLSRGATFYSLKRFEEALASFDQALAIEPDSIDGLYNRAAVLLELNKFDEALVSCDRVLALDPGHLWALHNRAVALGELKRFEEALASYDGALAIEPNSVNLRVNRAGILFALRRCKEAVADYDRALAIEPKRVDALNGRAVVLISLGRFQEALAACDRALAINPGYAHSWNSRANALTSLGHIEEALASYDRALAIEPLSPAFLVNRALLAVGRQQFEEALVYLEKALAIAPEHHGALSEAMNASMRICDWRRRKDHAGRISELAQHAIIDPFVFLHYFDEPKLQLRCSKAYIEQKAAAPPFALGNKKIRRSGRARIAYLSADFREHAVSYLTAELFERHDRSRFEVFGISFGPDDKSEMRARLVDAFDHFHDVRGRDDGEIAELLAELEIDIAVDLNGHTKGDRIGILARRPAPVQVSYLGFPGTTGANFIDYVIADAIVLPVHQEPFWSEKIVRLPECFQVNDTKRRIAERTPSRKECGLPERGFVFCCFNNNCKITPQVFDVWMRLLAKVEESVLWLVRDNAAAERNLRREAAARGIDPARLIFADRLVLAEHLARHRLADLFLDTLPFNAGATASDALWAGLPVLTCLGQAFAGRMAGSLLHAIGLPELVTQSLDEYEAVALKLANEPSRLPLYKERLEQSRLTAPLFDTDRFRHHIEQAYVTMLEVHDRGEEPRGFSVKPIRQEPRQRPEHS